MATPQGLEDWQKEVLVYLTSNEGSLSALRKSCGLLKSMSSRAVNQFLYKSGYFEMVRRDGAQPIWKAVLRVPVVPTGPQNESTTGEDIVTYQTREAKQYESESERQLLQLTAKQGWRIESKRLQLATVSSTLVLWYISVSHPSLPTIACVGHSFTEELARVDAQRHLLTQLKIIGLALNK